MECQSKQWERREENEGKAKRVCAMSLFLWLGEYLDPLCINGPVNKELL